MKLLQRWKQTSVANKLLVSTSALVAFGTFFYAGAAVFQVCLMKSSARETAKQADKIVEEAKRIADSTERTLAQSKAAMDASIEMSRNDQRAWVGPIETTPHPFSDGSRGVFLKEGSKATFGVAITNSGKTPARKVTCKVAFRSLPAEVPFVPEYVAMARPPSNSVMQPGVRVTLQIETPPADNERGY